MEKLFKPEGDLMSQLYNLTKEQAPKWYKQYLNYHKGTDQGVYYVIGYFSDRKANMLRKAFKLT